MNYNNISPYIRRAMYSVIEAPFQISKRIIMDYELIYVEDGECNIMVDGVSYLCKKGDIVFLRPGIEHLFQSVGNTPFNQPHIHFDMVYDELSPDVYICFSPIERLPESDLKLIRKDIIILLLI